MNYGIDLSFWKYPPNISRKPDWTEISKHVNFAILGVTELNGPDVSFEHNYVNAVANGVKVGVYKFSYAKNIPMAKDEAKGIVKALNGRPLDLPVFLDLEWDWQAQNLSKEGLNNLIDGFRQVVEDAGYQFGIYCNLNWYNNYLPESAKSYPMWVASYPYVDTGEVNESLKPSISNLVCWQFSENYIVPGIAAPVDGDVWTGTFPETVESVQPSTDEKKPLDLFLHENLPIVLRGSTGYAVRYLQKALNLIDNAGLEEDGVFGFYTEEAVIYYQIEEGLAADGIVGPVTWKSLDNSIAALAVIQGLLGNGKERKKKLKEFGYDFQDVQNEVNRFLTKE